jgi:hypothetical protein
VLARLVAGTGYSVTHRKGDNECSDEDVGNFQFHFKMSFITFNVHRLLLRGIVLPQNTIMSINNIRLTFRSLDGIYFDFDVSFPQTF